MKSGDFNLISPVEAAMLLGRNATTIRAWLRDPESGFAVAVEAQLPGRWHTIALPRLARYVFGDEAGDEIIPTWRNRVAEARRSAAA